MVAEFPIPTANSNPTVLTPGPDGNVYFAEASAGKIGRVTPAGAIAEFVVSGSSSNRGGVTFGADGSIWFTETPVNLIGRLTPGVLVVPAGAPANPGTHLAAGVIGTAREAASLGAPPVANRVPTAAVSFALNDRTMAAPALASDGSTQPVRSVDPFFTALASGEDVWANFLEGDDPFAVSALAKSSRRS